MPQAPRILSLLALGLLLMSGCSDNTNPFDPDECVPIRITDARLSYADSTDEAYLTWTSPIYCTKSREAERYEIRYFYDGPFVWDEAFTVIDPPAALPTGEMQTYRFRYPDRGRPLYMAVASVGQSGIPAPPSNTAFLNVPGFAVTGVFRDIFTGAPLANAALELRGSDSTYTLATDMNGEFSQTDLAPQEYELLFRPDVSDPEYFGVALRFTLAENVRETIALIPFRMSDVLPATSMLTLFKTAVSYAGPVGTTLMKWARRPVRIYIPSFMNGAGVDYTATAHLAVERWMERTGCELYRFVDAPPDTGVVFRFRTRAEMGSMIGVTRHTFGTDGLPLKDTVDIVDDLSDSAFAYRVMLHETGHTIQLKHLANNGFIMYGGQPLPLDISDDEVWIVRLLEALPNRTELSIYQEVGP